MFAGDGQDLVKICAGQSKQVNKHAMRWLLWLVGRRMDWHHGQVMAGRPAALARPARGSSHLNVTGSQVGLDLGDSEAAIVEQAGGQCRVRASIGQHLRKMRQRTCAA